MRNIGIYIESQTDKLLVGNRASDSMLGIYSVAHNIAAMPTTELLAPLGRVLFPNFVQKRDDPLLFAQSLTTAIGIQALIAIPACIGMAVVADDAVLILLGPGWALAAPLIQIMALTNLVISLAHSTSYALLATGKVKLLALIAWLQAIIFLTLAILFFPHSGVIEIASMRMLAVAIGSTFLISIALIHIKVFHLNDFFMQILRPVIASGAMVLLLTQLHIELINLSPVARILIEVVLGCVTYILCIGSLWSLQGRPEGAETYLIKNIKYKFRN